VSALPDKIALVTPWFSSGNGGAEVFCGGLARALLAIGKDVEILTTCCRDPFHDWGENHLREGASDTDGVPVRRFRVRKRDADLYSKYFGIISHGGGVSDGQEEELLANTINSDAMYEFIASHHGDYLFFFLPYLYGTTYFGVRAARREHAFLIPCLHSEPMAYLGAMQKMFRRVSGCLFLSEPERDFATALYDLSRAEKILLGAGVNREMSGDADRFRSRFGTAGPFALYAGRKVPGKGADLLIRLFTEFAALNPDESLNLVLLGGGDVEIPSAMRRRILSLLPRSHQDIYDAMAACEFLIHPSLYESFSLVMMEAWLHRKAVLVNGECDVTRYHVLRSGGGLYFTSFGEFAETVALLRSNPFLRERLGAAGERYVMANYTWHDTALRFQIFLASIEAQQKLTQNVSPVECF
jgi:glycosyltransferase involved in cell wall biosynthesis